MTPKALTIAGSDSGGCAGIQADLKTFGALEVHGMSVVTSVTAQDTQQAYMVSNIPLENIKLQFEVVVLDFGVDSVKTGMLGSEEIIDLIASKVCHFGIKNLVVDPVMHTTGGNPLMEPGTMEALKTKLLPNALIVTPNLEEAELLTGVKIKNKKEVREATSTILELGPHSVLLKGGHFENSKSCTDYFFDGDEFLEFSTTRIETKNTHGSGCTLAAAITAYLARGLNLKDAVSQAKKYVTQAILNSLELGHGHGPLGHFWKYW